MRLESMGQRHDAGMLPKWIVSLINHRSEKVAAVRQSLVRAEYLGLTWLDQQVVPVSRVQGTIGTEHQQLAKVQEALVLVDLIPDYWVIAKIEADDRWLIVNPYLCLSFGVSFRIAGGQVSIQTFYTPITTADGTGRRAKAADILEAITLSPLGTDPAVGLFSETEGLTIPDVPVTSFVSPKKLLQLEISDAAAAHYLNTLSSAWPEATAVPANQVMDFTPLAEATQAKGVRGRRAKVIQNLIVDAGLISTYWQVRKSRSTFTWQLFNPFVGRHVTVVLDRGDVPRIYKYQLLSMKHVMTDITTHYLLEAALLAPF